MDAFGPMAHHLHGGGPRNDRTLEVSEGGAVEIVGNALRYPVFLQAVTRARRKDLISVLAP
jgi:hypothetical protein